MAQAEAWHNCRVFPNPRIASAVRGIVLVLAGLCVGTLLPSMRYSLWWDAVCSLGGVVGILYGFVLIVRACAPNVSLRLLRIVSTVLLVSYLGWSLFLFLGLGLEWSGDFGHCQDLVAAAVQTNVVPQSVSAPGEPAVFCQKAEYGILRSRYQVLEIYSVPMDAQNIVLAALARARHRLNSEGVQVVFYQRENWRIGGPYNADGTLADKGGTIIPGSATRGPEKIERVSVIR
jgi:hypothetical protein